VSRRAIYAPFGDRTRLSWVWAAPLLGIAFLALAQIIALPLLIPFGAAMALSDEGSVDFLAVAMLLWGIVLISFAVFAGVAVFWTKVFERRSVASAGWTSRGFLFRYLRGVVFGLFLAAVVLAAEAFVAPDMLRQSLDGLMELSRTEFGVILLSLLAFMFVIQAGAEEFVFRGWMMSTITGRAGLVWGIALSSLAFALAHFHYALFNPLVGALAMTLVGLVGFILALYAWREGGVWGVSGAHTAYNFTLFASLSGAVYADMDGADGVLEELVEAYTDLTALREYDPALLYALVSVSLVTLLFLFTALRGRKRASESSAS